MKKTFAFLSLLFLLAATLVTPQAKASNQDYTLTFTVNGEEYSLEGSSNEGIYFNLDEFVQEFDIAETDKLESIAIETPEEATSVTFDFGLLSAFMINHTADVIDGRAEYVLSEVLGERDPQQDGLAISTIRQLLYPIDNHVDVFLSINNDVGPIDYVNLIIEADKTIDFPGDDSTTLSGFSLMTSAGEIKAVGAENYYVVNIKNLSNDTEISALKFKSETASTFSLFTSDSFLYADETDIKFANKEAVLNADKLMDKTGLPLPSSISVETLKILIGDYKMNSLNGVIADSEGNNSPVTVVVSQAGWEKYNNQWLYTDEFGVYAAGWLEVDGKIYYMDLETGVMQTGKKLIDGKWYFFHPVNGHMLKGHFKWNNKNYYLDPETGVMKTGWIKLDGKWFFFGADGAKQFGWVKVSSKWYYLDAFGAMQTGWVKVSNKWYYFDASGVMQTGWEEVNKKWYFFDGNGVMKTGWLKVGTSWYYLDSNGAMKTGWLKDGVSWYYLQSNGVMKTGWLKLGTKWYFFYNNGKMAANTTYNGYKFDRNGVWYR